MVWSIALATYDGRLVDARDLRVFLVEVEGHSL